MMSSWQPGASKENIKRRAILLQQIRLFMQEHDILEVETPVLSRAGNTDPHIHSLKAIVGSAVNGSQKEYYLNTSPEFSMKRLLASGLGPIYQITKVFRDDESGRLHQPEFTMLEWYRPEYDHHQLMQELAELISILGLGECEKYSYVEVFLKHVGLDPHSVGTPELAVKARSLGFSSNDNDRSLLLDFLFSHAVSPHLGIETPVFVYDYPVCQAALAKLSKTSPQVAERFELFLSGMEIADGFNELLDASEQHARFVVENEQREYRGLPAVVIDEEFLAALRAGLSQCAGVAVGVDRLLMALTNSNNIDDVMTFTNE